MPITASTMLAARLTRNEKSAKYQYSERRARPEKSTYFDKHVRTAVMKSMETPWSSGGAVGRTATWHERRASGAPGASTATGVAARDTDPPDARTRQRAARHRD